MEVSERGKIQKTHNAGLVITLVLEILVLASLCVLECFLRLTDAFPVRSVSFRRSDDVIGLTRTSGRETMAAFAYNADMPYSMVVALSLCLPVVIPSSAVGLMPLTAAEKQRHYRERRNADDARRQENLRKDRTRWHRNKTLVADMSERQHRLAKRQWKSNKQKQRNQHRVLNQIVDAQLSPPGTPTLPHGSGQRHQGRRKVRKERAAAYRKIAQLEGKLDLQRRLTNKYKKRCQRLGGNTSASAKDTPRTKTRRLLRHFSVSSEIRKSLIFHHAVVDTIRARYRETKSERHKQMLARIFSCGIIKRCRLEKYSRNIFGIRSRRCIKVANKDSSDSNRRERKCGVAAVGIKEAVLDFYERDDVSRCTTGKKETKTKGKVKKQKRMLKDSMINLHMKFLAEHPSRKISYSLFCQLRPFWVVVPTANDRETCLCKLHCNFEFMSTRLYQEKLLTTSNLERLVDSTACDPSSVECMHGLCDTCKEMGVEISQEYDKNENIWWWQWVTKKETYQKKKGDGKDVYSSQITVKEKVSGTMYDLVTQLQNRVKSMKRHLFNIRHQYHIYRYLRQNMSETECMLHIDFAENYIGKYSSEIQSVHFGGSHKQITLHTGVLYLSSEPAPRPFCTVSDSNDHSPYAIWSYLCPVLRDLKSNFSNVNVIHIFSDSPSTQYRQKKMFYIFCTQLYELGFSAGTWNYFEAGHGKGAPDGVGGALKRSADAVVANGTDLPDAANFYGLLADKTSIKLYFVPESTVLEASQTDPNDISSVSGTMTIHQLVTVKRGEFIHRSISCACSPVLNYSCACFSAKKQVYQVSQSTSVGVYASTDNTAARSHSEEQSEFRLKVGCGVEDWSDPALIGQYCCVEYDGKAYPGIIRNIDESDVEVQCMHAVGKNRFFWPGRADICWYPADRVLMLIPEPLNVTNRHKEVEPAIWATVLRKLSALLS